MDRDDHRNVAEPSSSWPRALAMVVGRPSTARTAVAPRHDDPRIHEADLLLQPHVARLDLRHRRALVDPALTPGLRLEVLDGVGDIRLLGADPGLSSSAASSRPAGPTNGWPSMSSRSPGCSPTSMIRAVSRPLTEHGLRGPLVQVVAGAAGGLGGPLRQLGLTLVGVGASHSCAWAPTPSTAGQRASGVSHRPRPRSPG